MASLLACLVAWATPSLAHAEPPARPDLVLVADPQFGIEAGVRTTLSGGRVLFRYEELLPRIVDFDESRPTGKSLGVLGRLLKLVFIDAALTQVETTVIHEVFGHGARDRELFGAYPSYTFGLPFPYLLLSPRQTYLGDTQFNADTGQRDKDIALRFGGAEANFLTAYWINADLVRAGGWVHHADLLVYGASKLVYASTFLSKDVHGQGQKTGDDLDAYVTDLQDRFNRWRPEDRTSLARKLQTAYAWNFLDPTLAFAIYGTLVDTLYAGKTYARMPLPSLGGVTFYPTTRFNLSPFGAEHYLDLFLEKRAVVADLYGRVGSSGLASYAGGGVRVMGWKPQERVSIGAELDVWSQPELLLDARNVYAPPRTWGMNGGAFGGVRLFGSLGLTGKLAYKTAGYLMGQPLDSGLYGYVGITVAQGP